MKTIITTVFFICAGSLFAQTAPEQPASPPENEIFLSPGIVSMQNGQWSGSEHLFNLPTDLGLFVEIVKPQGVVFPFNEESIKQKLIPLLKNAGIEARSFLSGPSTLPFLHLFLMVYPIEKGFVVYCALRLFEAVNLTRVHFKPDTIFQAITWEKQELLVIPSGNMMELEQTLQTISNAFANLFKSYGERDRSQRPVPQAPTAPHAYPNAPKTLPGSQLPFTKPKTPPKK